MGDPELQSFRGVMSLGFEGQEFTPEPAAPGDRRATLWVQLTPTLREQLPAELLVGLSGLPPEPFAIEFLGRCWIDEGAGHLSSYPGSVRVERVIRIARDCAGLEPNLT